MATFKIQDKTKIEPIVKFLVENGASVDGSCLPFEDSPLALARRLGLTDLFKWLDENRHTQYKNRPIIDEDVGCGCDEDCGCRKAYK